MLYEHQSPHGGDRYGKDIRWDFSVSVNPLGMPPQVRRAAKLALSRLGEYPDPYCRELLSALSLRENVSRKQILCGNGASELIYAYCRAVQPKRALVMQPTFAGYEAALRAVGCEIFGFLLRKENDFSPNLDFLRYAQSVRPDVIFLCNPNNPTGRLLPPAFLRQVLDFCAENGVKLFLDECFLELTDGESLIGQLAAHPNLFVLRSFTKSYALAGLRLGYGLCADTALLARAAETLGPWNVSVPAQMAGIAAAKQTAWIVKTKKLLQKERAELAQALQTTCAYVCPSDANYLLFQAKPGLDAHLLRQGILIRACANFEGLENGWYRVCVHTRRANRALVRAMADWEERG